jgi:hypothetical protein
MKFNRLEVVVHDPNTKKDFKQMVNLIDWNHKDQAISMIAAQKQISEIKDQEQKLKMSLKY